jgi:hypothetical protein
MRLSLKWAMPLKPIEVAQMPAVAGLRFRRFAGRGRLFGYVRHAAGQQCGFQLAETDFIYRKKFEEPILIAPVEQGSPDHGG